MNLRLVYGLCTLLPLILGSITVYDGENYTGTSKTYDLPTTCNNSIITDGLNDKVSSIQVSGGCVRLWAIGDCLGGYQDYTANAPSMSGFDNSATSMGPCFSASGLVSFTVYDGNNFTGQSGTHTVTSLSCQRVYVNASSIHVGGGCVRLWNDTNCSGISKDYSTHAASMPDFDNMAKAYTACPSKDNLTVYDGANYSGQSRTYRIPTTCEGFTNGNWEISSIKVTGGCVRLWTNGLCSGAYKEYSANAASMPDFDNAALSMGPCFASNFVSFTIYDWNNYTGSSSPYKVTSSCKNLTDAAPMASSIRVSGGCVRLWSGTNCSGTSKDYSTNVAAMSDFDNMATSYGPCS
jgi:hypothetical protein